MGKSAFADYILGAYLTLFGAAVIFTGMYISQWEKRQPVKEVTGATVTGIRPYCHGGGEIFPATGGFFVDLGSRERIDFEMKNWDNTVKVGDRVDVSYRDKCPLFGNGKIGVKIDDYK